jgi:hypothetical protein
MGFLGGGMTIYHAGRCPWHAWGSVLALWLFSDCWILVVTRTRFIPIPAAILDDKCRAIIQKRVEESGSGRIRSNPRVGLGLVYGERLFGEPQEQFQLRNF